jgi:hypothetical protein
LLAVAKDTIPLLQVAGEMGELNVGSDVVAAPTPRHDVIEGRRQGVGIGQGRFDTPTAKLADPLVTLIDLPVREPLSTQPVLPGPTAPHGLSD